MLKSTSEDLILRRDQVFESHNVTEFGVIFNDGRWTVGFLIGHKRFVGSGDTPQAAYKSALEDLSKAL